jgi:hypothetical protein
VRAAVLRRAGKAAGWGRAALGVRLAALRGVSPTRPTCRETTGDRTLLVARGALVASTGRGRRATDGGYSATPGRLRVGRAALGGRWPRGGKCGAETEKPGPSPRHSSRVVGGLAAPSDGCRLAIASQKRRAAGCGAAEWLQVWSARCAVRGARCAVRGAPYDPAQQVGQIRDRLRCAVRGWRPWGLPAEAGPGRSSCGGAVEGPESAYGNGRERRARGRWEAGFSGGSRPRCCGSRRRGRRRG